MMNTEKRAYAKENFKNLSNTHNQYMPTQTAKRPCEPRFEKNKKSYYATPTRRHKRELSSIFNTTKVNRDKDKDLMGAPKDIYQPIDEYIARDSIVDIKIETGKFSVEDDLKEIKTVISKQ